jgi:hypothetical protein
VGICAIVVINIGQQALYTAGFSTTFVDTISLPIALLSDAIRYVERIEKTELVMGFGIVPLTICFQLGDSAIVVTSINCTQVAAVAVVVFFAEF